MFEAKAATATSLTLSITPTTVEHSSVSQPATQCTISILLTAGGIGLAGRTVEISWRVVGGSSWTSITSFATDGSGQFSATNFPPELIVSGVPFDYEFKAHFTPQGTDVGVYDGSQSVVIITLTPHALEATSLDLSLSPSTVEHSSASQPVALSTLSISLTKGGTGLAGRLVGLSWRVVGGSSWTSITSFATDGSGQFSATNVPLELITSGVCGDFELKVEYIPIGGDETDYIGSSDTCTFTVTPHVLEATSLDLSLSPSTVEHSSASQPVALSTLSISLTKGGTGLAGRLVGLSWRVVGGSSWTSITAVSADSSGQFSATNFPPELIVSGATGDFELKVEYIPIGGDETDYIGSSDTCTFTIIPASSDMTIVNVASHAASANHASSTGVTVAITDSSLADGFQFTVTTEKFGTVLPPGTAYFAASGNIFYDVQVLPTAGGSVGPDVMVTVQLTDPSFISNSLVSYWDGSNWVPVAVSFIAPHTVSFTVAASMLTGTPFVAYSMPIFAAPEYPIGALLSIGACFIALIAFRVIKKPR